MTKKEITMNMVMRVIEHSMTVYHNTVMNLFGTSGVEQMGSEPDIPQIIALKNDLHNIFKNIMEMEIVHQKYGWLGTSYMEVSVICDADGHHVSAFNFPAWDDVMRIFVRNILAIGVISQKRILTRIRSKKGWYAYDEDGLYYHNIATRTRKHTNDPMPIKMADILRHRKH